MHPATSTVSKKLAGYNCRHPGIQASSPPVIARKFPPDRGRSTNRQRSHCHRWEIRIHTSIENTPKMEKRVLAGIEVFLSYSHPDEGHFVQLVKHQNLLWRQGLIKL